MRVMSPSSVTSTRLNQLTLATMSRLPRPYLPRFDEEAVAPVSVEVVAGFLVIAGSPLLRDDAGHCRFRSKASCHPTLSAVMEQKIRPMSE